MEQTPITFNSRVPRELRMFSEMMVNVYSGFEGVRWSKNFESEIGFYYLNKSNKSEYFFGVWYDLWEHYEIPLSLTFDYWGKAPIQWHDILSKYINSKKIEGLLVKNYEGYTCVLFEYRFFKFDSDDDNVRLSDLYFDLTEYADSINK